MHKAQRLINHVALVLDGSYSMRKHEKNLVKVADEQIRHLALRSEELNQETRVSVYIFDDDVQCLIFDMDVMRLPSISDLYRTDGMTALVDAVVKSQEDLQTTSQLYGDHAFLTFVLTDGMENKSNHSWRVLPKYTSEAPDNWTVGFLVPDAQGKAYLNIARVDDGSISLWNADSEKGLTDSFTTIRNATDQFMTQRASGVRGTRSVFSIGAEAVNAKSVQTNLNFLRNVKKFNVMSDSRIDEFIKLHVGYYNAGMGYYQLTKTETIQPQKKILVVDKSNGNVYGGDAARQLVGLPAQSIRVKPDHNPKYDIFVQSTSLNRKLLAGTKVLVP